MPPDSEKPGSRQAARALWTWCAYWIGLFTLTHVPIPAGGPEIGDGDKVIHFLLYAGLTWLGARWRVAVAGRMGILQLITWAGVYMLFGIADEWLQQFVGRTTSFYDWLADVAGVAAMTLVLARKQPSPPR